MDSIDLEDSMGEVLARDEKTFSNTMDKLNSTLERARRSSSSANNNNVMNDCWDYPTENETNALVFNNDHDQLPTVEEARTHHAETFRQNKLLRVPAKESSCWKTAFFIVIGCLVGIVIGISVGFHEGEEFKKLENEAIENERDIGIPNQAPSPTSLVVTPPPTTSNIAIPNTPPPTLTPPPTPNPTETQIASTNTPTKIIAKQTTEPFSANRFEMIQQWLVDKKYSSISNDEDDYHYRATRWIAEEDEAQLSTDDELTFVERWVMALLYFASQEMLSTSPWSESYDFTSSASVCEWGKLEKPDYRVGVTCNDDGNIIHLRLVSNDLRGPLISELGLLKKLENLSLDHNALTGNIPDELGELSALTYLALHYNELDGGLPPSISALSLLKFLGLGDNGFTGQIPQEWKRLSNLSTLGLDDNFLNGGLEVVDSLLLLERFYLTNNDFDNNIENIQWDKLKSLEEVDLSNNEFVGSIPQSLLELPKLQVLSLGHNKLAGELPSSYPPASLLRYLALSGNTLSGSIDSSIGALTYLRHLDFSQNQIEGTLPTEMASLVNLEYLFLAHNSGFSPRGIPQFLQHLTSLRDLSLGNTNRYGVIPANVLDKLPNIVMIDLSTNGLEGQIPTELGAMPNLKYLLLNRNDDLTGTVPTEVQNLEHLSVLMVDQTSVEGDLDVACDRDRKPHVQLLGANCKNEDQDDNSTALMECKCCAVCCDTVRSLGPPDDTLCHDETYFGQEDPIWENSYQRKQYNFGGEIFADLVLDLVANVTAIAELAAEENNP